MRAIEQADKSTFKDIQSKVLKSIKKQQKKLFWIAIKKFVETAIEGLDELKKIIPDILKATKFQGNDVLEKEFKKTLAIKNNEPTQAEFDPEKNPLLDDLNPEKDEEIDKFD